MRPGETVSHYEILAPLGGGGMGVVYAARDLRLGRRVALKFLSPEVVRDPNAKSRFVQEARAASALEHPNICTIHDVDETPDGHFFLVMALYEGETLRDRIERGPLRLVEALRIAAQVARGLAAAHAAGIVHRDIKPANIMLPQTAEAKILDFGLAKLAGTAQRLTRTGTTLGTLAYMAPEQVSRGAVDARSDLWSLGAVLYEMITGRLPFEGEGSGVILYSILERKHAALASTRPDVPPEVEAVVDRLLEKDPELRFGSAAEAAAALDQLASGASLERTTAMGAHDAIRPSIVRTAPRPSPPPRWIRKRALWSVGAVAAVVLLALAATLWRRGGAGADHPITTLAVLPFANLTGDSGREYVAEGISSVLIQQLSALPRLSVAGRSETWTYKGQSKTSRAIAQELGVGTVLEGQVLRMGDRLRVQASLVDARTGFVLWSKPVEGREDEIARLQEEIAVEISQRIAPELPSDARQTLARRPTSSTEAYDLYLRALRTIDEVENDQRLELAANLLERAVRLDPGFALGHAILGQTLAASYLGSHDAALLGRAEAEARTAIRLDPSLPEARIALGRSLLYSGHGQDAIAELRELVARHPTNDAGLLELARAHSGAGDLSRAETALRQALALRPSSWWHWNELGAFQMDRAGDYKAARKSLLEARRLAPAAITWPTQNLATLSLYEGDFAAAVAGFEQLPRPITDPEVATSIGTAYFYAGRLDEVEEYYRLAVRLRPTEAVFHANLGDLLVRQGDGERARQSYAEAARLLGAQLTVNPEATGLALNRASYLARAGACADALNAARELATRAEATSRTAHRLAQVHALCGRPAEAVTLLRTAIERGYAPERIAAEDEFRSLADDPEFRRLVGAKG
jgi:serine/threonine-protein kinase